MIQEEKNQIPEDVKQAILELDPKATFNGTIIYTKLDYGILSDIISNN
jgi:hypothetical protein